MITLDWPRGVPRFDLLLLMLSSSTYGAAGSQGNVFMIGSWVSSSQSHCVPENRGVPDVETSGTKVKWIYKTLNIMIE